MSNKTKKREDKKNKKIIFGLLALLVAGGILTGSLIAFFSDTITGNGTVTAGTLDITGSFTLKHYNAAGTELAAGPTGSPGLTATAVPNFNPGDLIEISATALNAGNKSAHIRGSFTITGALISGSTPNKVRVVAGSTTKTATACAAATELTPSGSDYNITAAIINGGSGTNDETETGGVTSYPASVLICLPTTATNASQGLALSVVSKIQAMQYRNNASPVWTDVVTTPFGN